MSPVLVYVVFDECMVRAMIVPCLFMCWLCASVCASIGASGWLVGAC